MSYNHQFMLRECAIVFTKTTSRCVVKYLNNFEKNRAKEADSQAELCEQKTTKQLNAAIVFKTSMITRNSTGPACYSQDDFYFETLSLNIDV